MAIAFIADLHLTPERPSSNAWFEEFMGRAGGMFEQIYILGDLFEFWIGDDGNKLLGQEQVESTLARISDSNVDLYFMHGNRDFLVGSEFTSRTGCTLLQDPTVISLDGMDVLLTHGDALCTDDVEHQAARKTMLTDKWKFAFLNRPLDDRLEQARAMRNRSESNKQIKSMEIMDVNQEKVADTMREHNVLTMIHGHTHRPAVHNFILDGQTATRFVLGDWYTQKSMLIYDGGRFSLRR